MSLEGATEEQLAALEKALLHEIEEIENSGRRAGNISLQKILKPKGWSEDQYWQIRDRLVDKSQLERGGGKGGSVRIVKPAAAPASGPTTQAPYAPEPAAQPAPARLREDELYDPVAETLRSAWVKDMRYGDVLLDVTARQGKRDTGGKWTRPDITLATMTTLLYVPGKLFDVVTFEIKPSDAIDVTAVYEALAHRRAATRSYVWIHVPESSASSTQEALDAIVSEAKRHGIGVISAGDPKDYETWDELVEATRAEPDPQRLNDFITVQFTAGNKDELLKWMR
jgi:hypothetical protein